MTENISTFLRQYILKIILKCFGLTVICVLIGLPIMFHDITGNLEGNQGMTILVLFDLFLAFVYSSLSSFCFLTLIKFKDTYRLPFILSYFIPIAFPTTIIIFLKIQNIDDRLVNVPIITAIPYTIFWTYYFFKLNRELKNHTLFL